jgi:hypothetical protein
MPTGPLRKVLVPTAAEICKLFRLTTAAHALLDPAARPHEYLDLLITSGHLTDAIRFLAHALPKRDAVAWACLATRSSLPLAASAEAFAALEAAEAWVAEPSEDNRRVAMAKAEAAQFQSPASWAAVGAFWSGGSMAPAGAPEVPPAASFTAAAVTGALILAAVHPQPDRAERRYRTYLKLGIALAQRDDDLY